MCTNYAPLQRQVLLQVFGIKPPDQDWKPETYRDYLAPIVRAGGDGHRECVLAGFGMVPRAEIKWRNEEAERRTGAPPKLKDYDTMNARLETIGSRGSFKGPWAAGQLCLIPAAGFYEPYYESASAPSVRWRIYLAAGEPFAIAGLWSARSDGALTFTMPTVNAESHSLLSRFHRPGKEKRGVVVLPRAEWDDWLTCRDPERARTFLRLYPAEGMAAEPAPLPPRVKAGQ
ncbi:SOS response-associated peptidase [Cupriavidus basilensis]|uniref:SOS response-associated peptidase n=1 Tax=Cupriavidus basilensis TaxID=68895 RepID=UPI000750EFCD|nr:SOS response-associated peptidase family protein [Cupriavidus basilensis]